MEKWAFLLRSMSFHTVPSRAGLFLLPTQSNTAHPDPCRELLDTDKHRSPGVPAYSFPFPSCLQHVKGLEIRTREVQWPFLAQRGAAALRSSLAPRIQVPSFEGIARPQLY